MYLYVTIKY